jgi:hypothetical protein
MTKILTSDFEEKVRGAMEMSPASPEFVTSLWNRLAEQPARKPSFAERLITILKPRWAVPATMVLVLSVLFTLIGPQQVLAAVQVLFSYLPGVGPVINIQQAGILSEPVRKERDGYVVSVENLVASPEWVWLRLKIEGWQNDPDYSNHPELQGEMPFLRGGDGSMVQPNQSDTYFGDALYAEYQFPPLPVVSGEIILTLPQIPETLKQKAPENWVFNLPMRKAELKDTLPDAWSGPRSSSMVNGVAMSLLQVEREADATYFTVRFQTSTLNDTLAADWYSQLSLKDDRGQILPVAFEKSLNGRTIMFRTRSFEGNENLTLRLERLLMVDEQPLDGTEPSFVFDPGANPAVGQSWTLDQMMESGPFKLHVVGASLQKSDNGALLLIFDVERPETSVKGLMFTCSLPLCVQSTTQDLSNSLNKMLHPMIQITGMPTEAIRISLRNLYSVAEGPWEIRWQPRSVPVALRRQVVPVAVLPTPTLPENHMPVVTSMPEGQSPNSQLADEVRGLLQKGFQELYGQAGWIHVRYEDIEPENTANFQSGKIGPHHSLGETWQYVEADGTISKQVWIEKTPDGTVWQKIARIGQTQVNFTAGTAVDDPALITRAQLDPLPETILQSRGDVSAIREEALLDHRLCLQITIQTIFNPPTKIDPLPKKVVSTNYKVWIDRGTGQILKVESLFGLEDGTDFVMQTLLYPTKERVDKPPKEIIDLLNRVGPK